MTLSRLVLLGLLVTGSACLEDMQLEEQTFPCRAAEDCVDGFECHAQRFVCVAGAGLDAGQVDAGTESTDAR